MLLPFNIRNFSSHNPINFEAIIRKVHRKLVLLVLMNKNTKYIRNYHKVKPIKPTSTLLENNGEAMELHARRAAYHKIENGAKCKILSKSTLKEIMDNLIGLLGVRKGSTVTFLIVANTSC